MLFPMFMQYHAGGVPTGDSHDATAGMNRAAADIHVLYGRLEIRIARHGAHVKHLVK